MGTKKLGSSGPGFLRFWGMPISVESSGGFSRLPNTPCDDGYAQKG
jgi:hypothetical protein